ERHAAPPLRALLARSPVERPRSCRLGPARHPLPAAAGAAGPGGAVLGPRERLRDPLGAAPGRAVAALRPRADHRRGGRPARLLPGEHPQADPEVAGAPAPGSLAAAPPP